jgi:hypothetical protein
MSAGASAMSVLKNACGVRLPSRSLTSTQRIGWGGVPVLYHSAVSKVISSFFSCLQPYQEDTVIVCHGVAGSESRVFSLGNGALLRRAADGARMAFRRRREEIGVEPQSADEGCAAVEGVGQFVDREGAVADEDDVATGQPAAELERAQSVRSLCLRPRCRLERYDGASRVKTGRAFTTPAQGTGVSTMKLSKRSPLALTKWPWLERTGSR